VGANPGESAAQPTNPRPRPNPTANGFGGDLHARHYHDHTRLAHEFGHTHPGLRRDAERVFDRLNPDCGLPADQRSVFGRQAVRDREAALALGVRVAVHDSRQNDRNPVIWQAGQDYRAADAIHAARHQPARARWGRSGSAPNAESARARSIVMAADNHTTIVGNLVDDPELRFTSSGIAVANLRMAVTQRVQQDGEWRDGDTSFLRVNVWRGQAEHLADSLAKGDRVMVTGRLRQRSWETPEGDKRSVTEVEADEVGASLKWATARSNALASSGDGAE
jgi:single-strand DNA-binding protein